MPLCSMRVLCLGRVQRPDLPCQDDTREVSLDLQMIQSMGRNLKVRTEATVGRS